jgi:hypothetical protein
MARRLIGIGLLAASSALAAPPAVNLRVELRFVGAEASSGARADVVVGTRGGTPAAAGSLQVQTAPRDAAEAQQVLVLNGARATVATSRLVPLPTGEWAWSGGTAGVGRTWQWRETGRGFTVKPSWPGGSADVTVDIAAAGAEAASTRFTLPLDTWRTFAQHGSMLLQLRVSRP